MSQRKTINGKLVLQFIEMRRKTTKDRVEEHLSKKEYGQAATWDAVDVGLSIAERIVQDELKERRTKKCKTP